jgi:hypothetical protein
MDHRIKPGDDNPRNHGCLTFEFEWHRAVDAITVM